MLTQSGYYRRVNRCYERNYIVNWSFNTLLWVHVSIITLELSVIMIILYKRGLFRWTSVGFWSWASFLLYFVLNPFFSLINHDTYRYGFYLSISGGINRGIWILLITFVAIMVFFLSYFRTQSTVMDFRLKYKNLSIPMILMSLVFIGFGIYSLLAYRALILKTGEVIIEEGRFVGDVTGYEYIGYKFLFVPIVIALLAESRLWKIIGFFSALGLFFLAQPIGWARFALVSLLLAVSIAETINRKAKWPHIAWIIVIIVLATVLQQRGHTEWVLAKVDDEIISLASESVSNISNAVGSQDASMLATWYVESYVKDTLVGYDYGLRLINYIISGWIPGKFFSDKYFIIDWLENKQPVLPPTIESMLQGAKSTLFGSFYCEGGIFTVILLSFIIGFLARKMDGMLLADTPILVKATGVVWISTMWMMLGSSESWVIINLGTFGLPSLAMWLVAKKQKIYRI